MYPGSKKARTKRLKQVTTASASVLVSSDLEVTNLKLHVDAFNDTSPLIANNATSSTGTQLRSLPPLGPDDMIGTYISAQARSMSTVELYAWVLILDIIASIAATFAWYFFIKPDKTMLPYMVGYGVSVAIAIIPEYIPNYTSIRMGYAGGMSVFHLGVLYSLPSWIVFLIYTKFYMNENLNVYDYIAFVCIIVAVVLSAYADQQRQNEQQSTS